MVEGLLSKWDSRNVVFDIIGQQIHLETSGVNL